MSSKKDPEFPKPKTGVSRRGFLRGVGIGGGAAGNRPAGKEAHRGAAGRRMSSGPGAVPITLNINGKPVNAHRRTARHPARRAAQSSGPDRRQARLRPRHLRRLHRHPRRQERLQLHRARHRCAGQGHRDHRRPRRRGKLHPVSAAFVEQRRAAVRLLHAGLRHGRQGLPRRASQPHATNSAKTGLGGNLCRCGTYVGVRQAVLEAAKK